MRIRLISSKIEQSHCPEEMVQRMFALGGPYPSEFPYRSKALVAFQRHEGIDVAFFAMYVQEYGDDCPEPNKNRVYISYLDSVRYFTCSRPNQRTLVYHSILVAYLAYVRVLGFKWVHIWVEPPKAGDEYIFFARPDQHKRPMKRDKLRAWYVAMLERAKEKDVVRKFGARTAPHGACARARARQAAWRSRRGRARTRVGGGSAGGSARRCGWL